jgi:hypothetical protein
MNQLVEWGKQRIREMSSFNKKADAFRSVFYPKGGLAEEKRTVLKELYNFCYVGATDHGSDPIKMARAVGRREVYQWILGYVGYESFDLDMLIKQMKEEENEW